MKCQQLKNCAKLLTLFCLCQQGLSSPIRIIQCRIKPTIIIETPPALGGSKRANYYLPKEILAKLKPRITECFKLTEWTDYPHICRVSSSSNTEYLQVKRNQYVSLKEEVALDSKDRVDLTLKNEQLMVSSAGKECELFSIIRSFYDKNQLNTQIEPSTFNSSTKLHYDPPCTKSNDQSHLVTLITALPLDHETEVVMIKFKSNFLDYLIRMLSH
jgi:hypothetical protein